MSWINITVVQYRVRTGVWGSVRCWQVGPCFPGLGFEPLLAALAVLAGGVVFTLALEVALTHQALGGMEVTLTPGGGKERRRK